VSTAKTKTSKKRKFEVMRFRRGDPAHNLIAAATHWIKAHGGTAVVIGGIEVITFPGDLQFNYRIAIRVTGKKPAANKERP
jgi:hypothetical protein